MAAVGAAGMMPLSDSVPTRHFPWVNVGLIVANFAVFLVFELPDPDGILSWSFYPCAAENACHTAEPWGLTWLTAMFLHAGWSHLRRGDPLAAASLSGQSW